MNTGVISSRYAKALLLYADETGTADKVCAQIETMLEHPDVMPAELEPAIQKIVALLVDNGRKDFLYQVLRTYLGLYYKFRNIHIARLVTSVESPEVEARVCALLKSKTGGDVVCRTTVDPELIGGFSVEVDGYLMDASVRRQLERIRTRFLEKNSSI